MEMNTLSKALLTTATSGFVAATPVHITEHCFGVNQNNAAQYDIHELISRENSAAQSDIAIHQASYIYNPPPNFAGTSPAADIASDDSDVVAEVQSSALDVVDMVARIKGVFGLNGVQMAQAIRVSRPTLYNHLKGKECDQSFARYQELYALANEVDEYLGADIRKGLKSVLVDGKTLLSYLKEEVLDHEEVLEVSYLIKTKLANSARERISTVDQIRSSRSVSHFG